MTNTSPSVPIDRDSFRQALRAVASSVAVVTTCHDSLLHGMTATAFSSVTADPPTILIVVNQSTRSHPLIKGSRAFVVNFLSQSQQELSNFFAGKSIDQFASVIYKAGLNNAPIIDGVAAYLDCVTISETNFGTHTIFLAHVIGASSSTEAPLLYHDGQYKQIIGATI